MINVRFFVRTIIVIVPVCAVALFIWQDLATNGEFAAKTDLRGYNPYISSLYPLGRVGELAAADGVSWRQIMAEPVYFDARVPRRLKEATVRVVYKANDINDFKIGLKVGGQGDWLYDFKELSDVSAADSEGWRTGQAVFNLKDAAINTQKVRFAFSAPSLKNSSSKLLIMNIEVKTKGESMNFSAVVNKAARKLIKYLPYAG